MTNDTNRPPLDLCIIDMLNQRIREKTAKKQAAEVELDDAMIFQASSSSGYSPEEIEHRIKYFIDEGVLKHRITAEHKNKIVSFVDLDECAVSMNLQCYFDTRKTEPK